MDTTLQPRNTVSSFWAFAAFAFCVLMLTVHVLAGLNSGGLVDFWRDMYWATVIANGERFPLSGPPINGVVDIGPWWFYVLALPIWITHRIAVASAFLQALGAMKYFLAWRIGTRLLDARFGFVFAVSLAIAGWSTAGFWFPSHPAVAETCVLVLALSVWRCWDRLSVGNASLFGLAAAACLHAHPTTVTYIFVGAFLILHRHRSWRSVGLLSVSALIVFMSLLPPWLDPTAVTGDRTSFETYAQQDVGIDLLDRIPAYLHALLLGGAWMGLLLMTPWKAATVRVGWWLYCTCLAFIGTGVALTIRRRSALRAWFAWSFAMFLLQILFTIIVRDHTPIWMVPPSLPPLAFCMAIGWMGWFDAESASRRALGFVFFSIYLCIVIAPFGLFVHPLHSLRAMRHANPFINAIDQSDEFQSRPVSGVSVRQLDAVSQRFCGDVTLHARLGAIIENAFGSSIRNACGKWPNLHYAGSDPQTLHIAGFPAAIASAVDIVPDEVIGGIALFTQVRPIAPEVGRVPTSLERGQVKPLASDEVTQNIDYEFEASCDDTIVLTSRYQSMAPTTVLKVTADGRPADAHWSDGRAWTYQDSRCASDSATHWHFSLDAADADIDLIALSSVKSRTKR